MVTRVGILQAKSAEPALRAVPGADAVGQVCQSRQREPPWEDRFPDLRVAA
jgi:hypothetical protein